MEKSPVLNYLDKYLFYLVTEIWVLEFLVIAAVVTCRSAPLESVTETEISTQNLYWGMLAE